MIAALRNASGRTSIQHTFPNCRRDKCVPSTSSESQATLHGGGAEPLATRREITRVISVPALNRTDGKLPAAYRLQVCGDRCSWHAVYSATFDRSRRLSRTLSFSSAPLVPLTNKRMKLTAGPGLRPKRQTTFVPECKDLKTSIENNRILGSSALLVVSTSCRSCPATSSYDRNVVMKYTTRLVVTHLLNHQNRAGPGHR